MSKVEPASVGRACKVIGLARSQWYYISKRNDQPVIDKLQELAARHATKGFETYFKLIRREGLIWNRKRVLKVYRLLNLRFKRRGKKRLPARIKEPLAVAKTLNHTWSMDFMSDALSSGRRLRVLNIMDDYSREMLAVHVDYSIPGQAVIQQLAILEQERGLPEIIRVDNGPEFTGFEFAEWCRNKGITVKYIQPGKPMQNAFIERLNKTYREDVLNAYLFDNLEQVRILSDEWLWTYNKELPHGSIGDMTPYEFARLVVNSGKLANAQASDEFTTINNHSSSNNSLN